MSMFRDLKTNIVLIGMPGSGKSAIGKAAAKKLSKNFVDTDELIERRYGRIPDIFNKQGETVFRDYERQAVSLAADIRGTVTATGGGVILDKRNIDELKKTGLVVFIDRPLSDLIEKTDGSYRPLIAGDNSRIKTLYEQRYPLYKKYADAVVINDEDIEKCVNENHKDMGEYDMKILVINGPNINMLGKREPDIYGKKDYTALLKGLGEYADKSGIVVDAYQSNIEGEIIDKIQSADGAYDGIVINPGAYTHYSIAILDALKAVDIPAVEVHLSHIAGREEFRHKSVTAAGCIGQIAGFGFDSYYLAIQALVTNLSK